MHLSPRRSSTCADLLRLAAAWLAVVLLLQGAAAAHAMASGPLHRHTAAGGAAQHQHQHQHSGAERHLHAAVDDAAGMVLVGAADDALDAVAFALTAALALLALCSLPLGRDPRTHVRNAALPWPPHVAWQALLHRPPRPC